MEDSAEKRLFMPAGGGSFKLVAPPMPQDKRFKPAGDFQIPLNMPKEPGPSSKGVGEIPAAPAGAPPTQPPVVAPVQDDAKIIARMENLLKVEKLASELEEENETLLKIVNRLKAEIATLKAK